MKGIMLFKPKAARRGKQDLLTLSVKLSRIKVRNVIFGSPFATSGDLTNFDGITFINEKITRIRKIQLFEKKLMNALFDIIGRQYYNITKQ